MVPVHRYACLGEEKTHNYSYLVFFQPFFALKWWLWSLGCCVGFSGNLHRYVITAWSLLFHCCLCCCWSLLYSAILHSQADSLRSHAILHKWLVFIARFWISTEVVYLQRWHGWCHMKLLLSQRRFCVHHTTMHHVTSCKATYIGCMLV